VITYRDGTPADAALMARLGADTFTETFGHLYAAADLALFLENHRVEKWRDELGNGDFAVRIAEAEGEPVGYAKVGPPSLPFEVTRPTAELRQFYVLKPWHGAGVAQALMAWVEEEARRRAAEQIFLSVFIDNHRARRFYERYGFEVVGTYHFMVGGHADDDLIMRKSLD
jgi:ribosomal protein S18 acetylase RimI-like enzyme